MAGGTFIIGLPGQTEEEILTFPEYARNLGMINAAFAIATPQAGTEFYSELDEKGLIDVLDWTQYDQMHCVFKHDNISKERLEQLLTHCIGRFYALDIFIDDMIESQFRNAGGRKITLNGALRHFLDRVNFILNAGPQYRPNDGEKYGKIFLQPQINPWTRKRTEMIGIHNMIHLDQFLKVFGNQKIQISLYSNGEPFIHYVLKTTKTKVEYLDICKNPHEDASLILELELSQLDHKRSKILLTMFSKLIKRGQLLTFLRSVFAGVVDHLAVTKSKKQTDPMVLPPEYHKTGLVMDGWDREAYQKIITESNMKKVKKV